MAEIDFQRYRSEQLRLLTNAVGVYALCDLDEVPIYIGKSVDGIRARVRRHLTSARSDVVANRQIDVWEVAFVWAWPVDNESTEQIAAIEAHLFHLHNDQSRLMNGQIPARPQGANIAVPEKQRVQVIEDDEINTRKRPSLRLPRQIQQFQQLVDYMLNVKDQRHLWPAP